MEKNAGSGSVVDGSNQRRFRVTFQYLMVEAGEVEAANAQEAAELVKSGQCDGIEVLEELKDWKILDIKQVKA